MQYNLLVVEKISRPIEGVTTITFGKMEITSLNDVIKKFDNLDLYDIASIAARLKKEKVIAIRVETRGYFDYTDLLLVPFDGVQSLSAHLDNKIEFPF